MNTLTFFQKFSNAVDLCLMILRGLFRLDRASYLYLSPMIRQLLVRTSDTLQSGLSDQRHLDNTLHQGSRLHGNESLEENQRVYLQPGSGVTCYRSSDGSLTVEFDGTTTYAVKVL